MFVSPGHGQPLVVVVRRTAGEEIVDDGIDRIRPAEPVIQRSMATSSASANVVADGFQCTRGPDRPRLPTLPRGRGYIGAGELDPAADAEPPGPSPGHRADMLRNWFALRGPSEAANW